MPTLNLDPQAVPQPEIRCDGSFCTTSEKLEGERVATRSYRVIYLAEVHDDHLVYQGDIDGDGLTDRFVGNVSPLYPRVTGQIEFGGADGTFSTELPARFRTAAGATVSRGEKVAVQHPYDTSAERTRVEGFTVRAGNPFLSTRPDYLYVSVEILTGSGLSHNVDQCSPL